MQVATLCSLGVTRLHHKWMRHRTGAGCQDRMAYTRAPFHLLAPACARIPSAQTCSKAFWSRSWQIRCKGA